MLLRQTAKVLNAMIFLVWGWSVLAGQLDDPAVSAMVVGTALVLTISLSGPTERRRRN